MLLDILSDAGGVGRSGDFCGDVLTGVESGQSMS